MTINYAVKVNKGEPEWSTHILCWLAQSDYSSVVAR